MAGSSFAFCDLMVDARRVTVALGGLTHRDSSRATAAVVGEGRRMLARLLDYQRTARMTGLEAHALADALDLLRARLKFFGESVQA
jgi:hypothetical protein